VVENTCNTTLERLGQEDHKFEANLGYIGRAGLQNKTKQTKQNNT
jgi:hypothetical protein